MVRLDVTMVDITVSEVDESTPMFELVNDAALPRVRDWVVIEILGTLNTPSSTEREVPERMRVGEERLPEREALPAWIDMLAMFKMEPKSSKVFTARTMLPPDHEVVGSMMKVLLIVTVILEVYMQ